MTHAEGNASQLSAPAAAETSPQASPAAELASEKGRVFTARALLVGLLSGLLVAALAYYNDYAIRQNALVGNHLPLTVYCGFFFFLIAVNPVLYQMQRSARWRNVCIALTVLAFLGFSVLIRNAWPAIVIGGAAAAALAWCRLRGRPLLRPFGRGELAVALGMALVACSLPTSGLMRNLPQMLVMPQHYGKTISDWERADPIRYVTAANPRIFPERDEAGKVYEGYVQGLQRGGDVPPLKETTFAEWFSKGTQGLGDDLSNLPLSAWVGPALTWFPIIVCGFIFVLAMCRIVHRQWSENEQLSYPIAEFAHTLLRNDSRRAFSDVFYSKTFWAAFAAVLCVHLINGWNTYDDRMIRVPLNWSISNIWWTKLQFLHGAVGPTADLRYGVIYLTVVAFAYFLPAEISFSLGIGLPLYVLLTATSFQLGHQVSGDEQNFLLFGSYVAMAVVIWYTGRYYYGQVFKCALGLKATPDADRSAVTACRWFVLATAGLIFFLMQLGLDWLLATGMVLMIGALFLVLARASAETGIPLMGTPFFANKIVVALLGPAALGPANLYLLQLVTTVFMQNNRETLAPYVVNGLRVADRSQASPVGTSRAMALTLVLGLFVAGIAVLYVIYSRGALNDVIMGKVVPTQFAKDVSRDTQKLKRTHKLETAKNVSGLERLGAARETHPSLAAFFLIGVGLVAVNSMLRLRYVWWPLHSVVFLFWSVSGPSCFAYSFLLGWLMKAAVVRIGGGGIYQELKPVFIGLIIGDLCGGMFWMLLGPLRLFWTGEAPRPYGIFPM